MQLQASSDSSDESSSDSSSELTKSDLNCKREVQEGTCSLHLDCNQGLAEVVHDAKLSGGSERFIHVDLVEEACEWAGLGSDSSSTESISQPSLGRRTRYQNMALAIEAVERDLCKQGQPIGRHALMPLKGLLLFFALNLRLASCLAVLFGNFWEQGLLHERPFLDAWFGILLISDSVFIIFQIVCACRDRGLSLTRQQLRSKGRWCLLALFNLYSVLVLGVLSGWQILRSTRQLRDRSYRDSFLSELNDLVVASDSSMRMPFFSSHLVFLLELPFVFRTVHVFMRAKTGNQLVNVLLACAWIFNFQFYIIALLAYDYNISQHIRSLYSVRSRWKAGLAHYVYRTAECLVIVLGLATIMLHQVKETWWPSLGCLVFALAKVAALVWASGACWKKAMLLGLPLFAANLALFVDAAEVAQQTRRLTRALDALLLCGVVAASGLYWWEVSINDIEDTRLYTFADRVMVAWAVMIASFLVCAALRLCSAIMPPRSVSTESDIEAPDSTKPVTHVQTERVFGSSRDGEYHYRSGEGLASLLVTNGIGDQLVALMEICSERKQELRLSSLKSLGKLGEGGFGIVYKVQDIHHEKLYALKLQRKGKAAGYAIREAQALHEVRHPFIVQIFQIFHTAAFYSILMELCDCDLNTCIVQSADDGGSTAGLPLKQVQHYTICMMLALEHLHDRDIVFRDLKPENVLTISEVGGECSASRSHAKLADFGLARSLQSKSMHGKCVSSEHLTTGIGTAAFMAAEAFECDFQTSEHSRRLLVSRDWYALGCCLLLMVLGRRAGRVVCAGHRTVLLPSAPEEFRAAALAAREDERNRGDPLGLALELTEQEAERRAGPDEMRASTFLRPEIPDMEAFSMTLAQQ